MTVSAAENLVVDLSSAPVFEEMHSRYLVHDVCPVISSRSLPPMGHVLLRILLPGNAQWQGTGRVIQSLSQDLHLVELKSPPDWILFLSKEAQPTTSLTGDESRADHSADEPPDEDLSEELPALEGDNDFSRDNGPTGLESDTSNLYSRIRSLTVPQKRQLARTGNRVARNLLIRDTNKAIHPFVLMNPRITLDEVMEYSKAPNLAVEALKTIAQNTTWMKSRQVVFNLVRNPSMPVDIASRLVSRLSPMELRMVAHSSGIRSPVAAAARKILVGGK